MAIIGIPAGFTAQPWQLKELKTKKKEKEREKTIRNQKHNLHH